MKILLFGLSEFCTDILQHLLNSKQEVCGLVFNHSNNIDIKEMKNLAKPQLIPNAEVGNMKDQKFISWVNKLQPDLMIVATFSKLVPKEVYSLARIAAINIHPSYLPEYRGGYPYFWPIVNGETHTGITIHLLTEEFDAGDIIVQEKVPLLADDTQGMVIHKQKAVVWQLLEKILDDLERSGQLPRATPQQPGEFVKAPRLKSQQFVINWHWPSQKVLDWIRALNPHAPAYTFFRDELIGIYEAGRVESSAQAEPGSIVALTDEGPVVRTGDGAIVLKIVLVGKRYLHLGKDFQQKEKVKVGDHFDR